jgi:hypothetical protein
MEAPKQNLTSDEILDMGYVETKEVGQWLSLFDANGLLSKEASKVS